MHQISDSQLQLGLLLEIRDFWQDTNAPSGLNKLSGTRKFSCDMDEGQCFSSIDGHDSHIHEFTIN